MRIHIGEKPFMCMEWKGCFLRGDYCKKHSWTHKKLGKRKEAEMDENVDECLHILGIYSASFLFLGDPLVLADLELIS